MSVMDITAQLEAVKAELATRKPRVVAERCDLAYDTVLRIMRGDHVPRLDTLQRLHSYLFRVSPADGTAPAKDKPVFDASQTDAA